jgi:outer membrane lipoprotein-sorting protein
MERSRSLLAFALCLLLAPTFAQEGPGASGGKPQRLRPVELPPALKRVADVAGTISFAGVRDVFMKRPGGEEFRTRERVLRQGKRIRIEFRPESAFAGQVIIEDGGRRLHYFPEKEEVYERPSFEDPLGLGAGAGPGPIRGRARGGRFVQEGAAERVAGIGVTVFRYESQTGLLLQRLWVDGVRGLILRRRAYGPDGQALAGFEYLSIKYSPPMPPRAFDPPQGAKLVTVEMILQREAQELDLKPYRLPASTGFRLTGARKMDSEKMVFLWQTYKKGRSRISLFVVKGPIRPDRLARLAGGGQVQSHTWTEDGVTFVLLGSVPLDELKALARTVTPDR